MSSSSMKEELQKQFKEDQDRQDMRTQRQLDVNISRIQYYMELTDNPDDLEAQLERLKDLHFDWQRYKCMDAALDNNISRYPMLADYYTSLRAIDVLLRPAIGNIDKHPDYRQSLDLWLADLPLILSCAIRPSNVQASFREPDYQTLQFIGHEYILERIPLVKLYVVTVSDDTVQVTKVFDYFFFYFSDGVDV